MNLSTYDYSQLPEQQSWKVQEFQKLKLQGTEKPKTEIETTDE